MIEIGFYIKKFISFFLEPLGLVLTLLFFGLYSLYLKKEHKAKIFLTAAFFILMIFSYLPFANYLIQGLEAEYPKYDYKENVAYIHVLGNGHTTDPKQPISSQISDAGVKRVLEGVIIHRKIPNSKIIFTGYEGKTDVSNAFMNAKLAKELGVSPKDILINPLPKDTKEEALFTKTIVQSKPFILVTSASHMPRAMETFKSIKLYPIPAPTDFLSSKKSTLFSLPSSVKIHNMSIATHEYLGIAWNKIVIFYKKTSKLITDL